MQRPTPSQLVEAAAEGEPIELAIDYQDLSAYRGKEHKVGVRLAQNVGPLLGVPNPDGPFGEMSWLSDFNDLTLGDIARGAPSPPKSVVKEMQTQGLVDNQGNIIGSDPFIKFGRYIYGDTPNTIVAASLNRFGPHPKMATTLTGINYLLRPQTKLIDAAVATKEFKALQPDEKLQTFGSMIVGAYCAQSWLVNFGVRARKIQQASQLLEVYTPPHIKDRGFARCEIGADTEPYPVEVRNLEIVDTPLERLAGLFEGTRHDPRSIQMIALRGLFRVTDNPLLVAEFDEQTGRRTARLLTADELRDLDAQNDK